MPSSSHGRPPKFGKQPRYRSCKTHSGTLAGRTQTIEIQLTPEERELLLRYGYPFERIEQAVKACEASPAIEIIPMDEFELAYLIGDVCRPINHMNDGMVQGQLLNLCDRLEAADRSGDGMLDVL